MYSGGTLLYIALDYVGLLGVPVTGEDPPDAEDIPDTGSSSSSSRVADIPLA